MWGACKTCDCFREFDFEKKVALRTGHNILYGRCRICGNRIYKVLSTEGSNDGCEKDQQENDDCRDHGCDRADPRRGGGIA